tara:strand:+ start:595 stop:1983 length:1389 start_codon:yes stop_codon:yes gene_type:complete
MKLIKELIKTINLEIIKKLLLILCCSAIMFSFSKDNDRILEIKELYSKIINDTSYKTDTVSWSVSENEYSSPLARTFVYSYFENNLSKLNCEIKQDDFFISSQYYFEDNVLFFAFLTYDYGSEKEENRLYFNKFGEIEKLLVNYGNGNKEINDQDEKNSIKESTLNWLEKGNANLENREKFEEETLNIQLDDNKVIIEKKSDSEIEINLIAENNFDWYDKLPLPKWYKNLTLDDKPVPKWLFYWSIFLFIFLLFRNNRKENKKTRELEKNPGFFNRIVNYIWHKSMDGKKGSLINSYDNDPGVSKSIDDVAKASNKLRARMESFDKMIEQDKIQKKEEKREQKKEEDKNEQETGLRETDFARIIREDGEASIKRENAKKKQLSDRFGIEYGEKIYNKEIWQGMTLAMLQICKGFPGDRKETIYKTKTKKQYFYDPYENRQKKTSYKLRVDLENDIVVGFKDL